jgi:hypothetical protein
MHAIPTLLQILLYLAALLAPEDATKITLALSPDESREFTKSPGGTWVLIADASEWKADGDFVVILPPKPGTRVVRQMVASTIDKTPGLPRRLRAHDWTMKPTLHLSGGLTLDKTDDGFRIHAPKEEESPEVDVRIRYGK